VSHDAPAQVKKVATMESTRRVRSSLTSASSGR
jgi:hypothetical protein